jgi:hypothetical protein
MKFLQLSARSATITVLALCTLFLACPSGGQDIEPEVPASPAPAPPPTLETADTETEIEVSGTVGQPTCTVTHEVLDCGGSPCGNQKRIWWDLVNHIEQEADVIVMDLLHESSGWYIDPLTGPQAASIHKEQVDAASSGTPGESTLRTKVKKKDGVGFGGTYKYSVGICFNNCLDSSNWKKCADPQVIIQQ